jgi:hypothetical protein
LRARRRVKSEDPLDTTVFFIDRCMGKNKIPAPLREAGLRIELHDDHFPMDAQDDQWLPAVGRKGWYVITRDERVRYRHLETTAARQAKVGMFVLVSKNITGAQSAEVIVKAIPRIRRFIKTHRRPFIARIYRDGIVKEL